MLSLAEFYNLGARSRWQTFCNYGKKSGIRDSSLARFIYRVLAKTCNFEFSQNIISDKSCSKKGSVSD